MTRNKGRKIATQKDGEVVKYKNIKNYYCVNLRDLLLERFNETAAIGEQKNARNEECHPVDEGLDVSVLGEAGGDDPTQQSNSSLDCHQNPVICSQVFWLPSQPAFDHSEVKTEGLNYHNQTILSPLVFDNNVSLCTYT